jgi:hypothetical protein
VGDVLGVRECQVLSPSVGLRSGRYLVWHGVGALRYHGYITDIEGIRSVKEHGQYMHSA